MRNNFPSYRRLAIWILIFVGLLSIVLTRKPHILEFVHYYLGSKYNYELGYTGLYDAISDALVEIHGYSTISNNIKIVRNLDNDEYYSLPAAIEQFDNSKSKWSSERWSNFISDVKFFDISFSIFSKKDPLSLWRKILVDHGYNAPPTYTMYVAPIVNAIPLNLGNLYLLCSFDLLLLILIFIIIYKIFGFEGAALAFIFFSSASDMLSYTTFALFRFDWLFLYILSLLFIKYDKFLLAGIAIGISTALRIFPGVIAALFFLILLFNIRNENLNSNYHIKYLMGLFIGIIGSLSITVIGMALFYKSSMSLFGEYFTRINIHAQQSGIVNIIGLGKLFAVIGLNENGILEWIISIILAFVLVTLLLKHKFKTVEHAALSILTIPIILSISHYYYLILISVFAINNKMTNKLFIILFITNIFVFVASISNINYFTIVNYECIIYSIVLVFMPITIYLYEYILKYRKEI